MKMTYGRKFWACLIAQLCITAAYFVTLFKMEEIAASITILYIVMSVTIATIYIGGNTFKAWIKSKYFRSELKEGSDE